MTSEANIPAPQAVGEELESDSASITEAGPAAGAAAAESSARLAELQAKNAELTDAFLRAKADVENTRRRADEEVAKARKFAVESFAESLLPVIDSLEAAIAIPRRHARADARRRARHAAPAQAARSSATGWSRSTRPPGSKFDPHQHQAISVVPADGRRPTPSSPCCRRAT